jgi:ribosomal protein L24
VKPGDKVKVIKGEYSGRIGIIKKVNLKVSGLYSETKLTIIDEHEHTYSVRKDDVELLEG